MPSLRIELEGYADKKGGELTRSGASEVDVDNLAGDNEAPRLPVKDQETGEVEAIDKLKERLKLVELSCARLEELYQTYRLRWLEEKHRARVLEVYAPPGIDTCSPRQLAWNAPSPIQSEDEDEGKGEGEGEVE
ncbi:hypothetical protein EV702DRAFT_1043576 [Suillus placidus]|uniref:Uncharacterized protein n=1 Tax=Suillus placidus TaxID=48579 RepID=A0A9P7D5F0_9AGAM|nr:hypothetical protein EV702DRAFT_1043576 [Suillus placidus]